MAFATTDDVGARLGRELSDGETVAVELLLDGAAATIADAAGRTEAAIAAVDPVPPVLRFLSIEIACRALANPNSLDSLQEQIGVSGYSARFRADAGLMLTPAEERMVRRAVRGTTSGSARTESVFDEYVGNVYGS